MSVYSVLPLKMNHNRYKYYIKNKSLRNCALNDNLKLTII